MGSVFRPLPFRLLAACCAIYLCAWSSGIAFDSHDPLSHCGNDASDCETCYLIAAARSALPDSSTPALFVIEEGWVIFSHPQQATPLVHRDPKSSPRAPPVL
jgi:hypothetical protein